MTFMRFVLISGALVAASPALAQTYYQPRSYVEELISTERQREPVYEVRSEPRTYAPPQYNRMYTPRANYIVPRGERMYYNPYTRETRPRNARIEAPQNPAQPRRSIPEQFRKQVVAYDGPEKPGSIVIDTKSRFLYLIQNDGSALRYGVGVGRAGFSWAGTHKVSSKQEWPSWHPPAEMRQRRPDLPVMMEGGPDNPLGARALYLGSTLYRIHGSNEPWTIGQAVSSGCFRMTNEDVQDLYERVAVGTAVKVL